MNDVAAGDRWSRPGSPARSQRTRLAGSRGTAFPDSNLQFPISRPVTGIQNSLFRATGIYPKLGCFPDVSAAPARQKSKFLVNFPAIFPSSREMRGVHAETRRRPPSPIVWVIFTFEA